MEIDFTDIRIVSLEDEFMVPSPRDPSLFYVFLKLSETPPPLWQSTFRDSRKIARHPHWRHAWLDRKFIVIECLTDELEKYHLNDLKQDIARANKVYREYLQKQTHTDVHKQKFHLEEREKLREIKGRLNFD